MSTLDPFGRPNGGSLRRASRSAVRPLVVAFVIFDLMVLAVVGALFATGVFGGSGDGGGVVATVGDDDDADDGDADDGTDADDDGITTVVTRETGTSRTIDGRAAASTGASGDADEVAPAEPTPAGLNATSMIRESN